MRLLLDTHVLLWWHDQPARLTATAYSAIKDLGNDVFLSVVNGWEIQIKAQLGKLTLPKPLRVMLQEEQATNGFRLLPVTLEHVYALDSFPLHHRDPFDRLLIAQAHQEGLILVTQVAYLRAADNYDGPLAIRLKGCHQPVIRTPNGFSTPHSTLLAGI